jgi:hypothetical protein
MSKVLKTATAIVMLGLAATGAAQARGNFDRGGFDRLGYAGQVYHQHRASCGRGTCQATALWASTAEIPIQLACKCEHVND